MLGFGKMGLTLDLGLHIVDCVGGLDLKGNGLAREGLDEDLHDEDLERMKEDSQFLTPWVVAGQRAPECR